MMKSSPTSKVFLFAKTRSSRLGLIFYFDYSIIDTTVIGSLMKKDIHPQYYPKAKVTCACGNTFITGSTMPEIRTEICANCHPFFTGKQNLIDTAGRVERFQKIVKKSAETASKRSAFKKAVKKAKAKTESASALKKLKADLASK